MLKLRLLCCFTFISLSQNSFSMCFRRAAKPLSNIVRLSNLNKRLLSTFSDKNRKEIQKQILTDYAKQDVCINGGTLVKFPNGKRCEFKMNCYNNSFYKLLEFYRKSSEDSCDKICNLRNDCMSIMENISILELSYFCEDQPHLFQPSFYKIDLQVFFGVVANLVIELIKRDDKQFANILINWLLEYEKAINEAVEYSRNEELYKKVVKKAQQHIRYNNEIYKEIMPIKERLAMMDKPQN